MHTTSSFSYHTFSEYLGYSIMCIGGIILLPLLTLAAYPHELGQAKFFIVPGGISLILGYTLHLIGHGGKAEIGKQQDAVLVIAFWLSAIILCSLPFLLSGAYNISQSIFESASGWSTTGLSVVDVERCPKILLMYRSILLFFGGIGIVLVMSTILVKPAGMQLFNAEGHSDRLVPNLVESARFIMLIYSGYIVSGMLLYRIFGMGWFDAINHSIAAVSTGGFSTRAGSIGHYKSLSIELITVVLMILGNTGFLAHQLLLKAKIREFLRNDEFRFFILLLTVAIPLLATLLFQSTIPSIPEAVRVAVFQAVSALTTTGFQTVDSFLPWSASMTLLITLLMLVGGGVGSTAGGIKQYRVLALVRTVFWSLRDNLTFQAMVRHDKIRRPGYDETVSYRDKTYFASFIALYLFIYCIGVFILTLSGISIPDALFEFASAMGTVGLSRGIMVADAKPIVLWVGSAGMFIGRLEIIVIITAMHRLGNDGLAFVRRERKMSIRAS